MGLLRSLCFNSLAPSRPLTLPSPGRARGFQSGPIRDPGGNRRPVEPGQSGLHGVFKGGGQGGGKGGVRRGGSRSYRVWAEMEAGWSGVDRGSAQAQGVRPAARGPVRRSRLPPLATRGPSRPWPRTWRGVAPEREKELFTERACCRKGSAISTLLEVVLTFPSCVSGREPAASSR